MFKYIFSACILMVIGSCSSYNDSTADRKEIALNENWKFTQGDFNLANEIKFDDSSWQDVNVPHDWAIYGPFDKEIDKQVVRIVQNNEEIASEKTGRTGALPFIGVGWYRKTFEIDKNLSDKTVLLCFDGAMSNAQVYINGKFVGGRPYGYSYFYFDITGFLKEGKENTLAVRLENLEKSSRWYPGAGLYRKVSLLVKNKTSFEKWGHFISTPIVDSLVAKVNIKSKVENYQDQLLQVKVRVIDQLGDEIANSVSEINFNGEFDQNLIVEKPSLWSPDNPYLYTAKIELISNGKCIDSESIVFGIRKIEFIPEKGFLLNGKITKFKGVCLHHDLGPLGAAVNKSALRRQMTILKDMGANAIRSAHNMPSIEQLELANEMGFMFLAESFDEWAKPKVENGYNLYFEQWAQKDVENLVRACKNHPSIVMWSSGNEVPDQWGSQGVKRAKWLQDIFHREDATRPVTVGMDQVKATMESGFGAIMDIPGLNYRVHLYHEAYEKFPQGLILGSETASTVSSRGVYKFPVKEGSMITYPDYQSSSYDLEYCSWSNLPDDDFALQDDNHWVIGEFVWTGFDYLGEPTPYDEYWPSRSSYFGICDLAGLPKDRYYLYRSRWNDKQSTLHILPHWTWPGREGEVTPVFVYSSYPSVELFVNGVSQGVRKKNNNDKKSRYRLMWMDVKYQPGSIKAVAYDLHGNIVEQKEVKTAGKVSSISLEADRSELKANGEDLCFVTVSLVDNDGNLCPDASDELHFEVEGQGKFRAVCNGDATSLELFHHNKMKAFNGKLVVIVQSSKTNGEIILKVSGNDIKSETIKIRSF